MDLRTGSRDTEEHPADFVQVGLDVGKMNDPSVAAVDHPVEEWTGRMEHQGHEPGLGTCTDYCFPVRRWRHDIRGIVTLPLGMPYPDQAHRIIEQVVVRVLGQPGIRQAYVIVDANGIGEAMVDALRDETASRSLSNIRIVAVKWFQGDSDQVTGGLTSARVSVSTACLFTRLKTKYQAGRIRLPRTLPELAALRGEMESFEFEITANGRLRFGAAAGKHDDRVAALALATMFEGVTVASGPSLFE